MSSGEGTVCAHRGAVRCWPCMTDGCYDQPTLHVWWDEEDVDHAKITGQEPVGIELDERYCALAASRLAQDALPFGEAS